MLDWAGRLLTGRSGANKMDWGSIYSEWFAEAGKTVGNVLEYYAPGVFVGEARARRKRAVEGYDETDRNDFGEFTGTLSAVLDEKLSALADRIEHITLKVTIDGEQITNTINKTNFRKTNTARYTKY